MSGFSRTSVVASGTNAIADYLQSRLHQKIPDPVLATEQFGPGVVQRDYAFKDYSVK